MDAKKSRALWSNSLQRSSAILKMKLQINSVENFTGNVSLSNTQMGEAVNYKTFAQPSAYSQKLKTKIKEKLRPLKVLLKRVFFSGIEAKQASLQLDISVVQSKIQLLTEQNTQTQHLCVLLHQKIDHLITNGNTDLIKAIKLSEQEQVNQVKLISEHYAKSQREMLRIIPALLDPIAHAIKATSEVQSKHYDLLSLNLAIAKASQLHQTQEALKNTESCASLLHEFEKHKELLVGVHQKTDNLHLLLEAERLQIDSFSNQLSNKFTASEELLVGVHQKTDNLHLLLEAERLQIDSFSNQFSNHVNDKLDYLVGRNIIALPHLNAWLIRTRVGYVYCDLHDEVVMGHLTDSQGMEPGLSKYLVKNLSIGDTFIDIGANVGLHTLAACKAVGSEGRVVAVEPNPRLVELLDKTLRFNRLSDLVTVVPCAIGGSKRKTSLHIASISGHSSIFPISNQTSAASVDVNTLAELLKETDDVPRIIKVDAEGAEYEILKSLVEKTQLLQTTDLILEFGPSHLARIGVSTDQWWRIVDQLKLDCFEITEPEGNLISVDRNKINSCYSSNLLMRTR